MLESRADAPPPDPKKKKSRPARRFAKVLDDEEAPLFVEKCDLCGCLWLSSIKFYNVFIRGFRPVHRVCQFCVRVMETGPAPAPIPEATSEAAGADPETIVLEPPFGDEEATV